MTSYWRYWGGGLTFKTYLDKGDERGGVKILRFLGGLVRLGYSTNILSAAIVCYRDIYSM